MAETSPAAASPLRPLVDTPARDIDDSSSSETDRESVELRHRVSDQVDDQHTHEHSWPSGHHHPSRTRSDHHQEEGAPSGDDNDDEEGKEEEEDTRDDVGETERFVPGNDPLDMATWSGKAGIKGSSEMVRMILLTFVSIGITFTWGIEMTYCTPYLLTLGLTKSKTSLVWVAGPLSGLIVQPIVGAISDESKSKWGRRRPLIVIGAVIVSTSLLVLGFTKELVGIFIRDQGTAKTLTIVTAVFSIYAVDFAINGVMSCARSLIVDTLPISKQQSGAAWSSRMGAIGHVIGYGMGAVDLVSIFGTSLGDSQFKQLTVIASLSMLICSSITCWAVTERILVDVRHDPKHGSSRFKPVRQIWSTLLHLPPRVRAICWAQFWSWIGWFPFLFYSTTWVGETYFRYDVPEDQRESTDTLGDIGRIGSTSLVIYSSITFIGAWLLPVFVKSPEDEGYTRRPPESIAKYVEAFNKYKPDLLTAWICGHLIFACAMFFAPFATSFRFATVLVAICGIPWALAMWAPTTFLGIEVNRISGGDDGSTGSYRRLSNTEIEMGALSPGNGANLSNTAGNGGEEAHSSGELSGIYFGILNIYTTLPQFVGTFISTVVFAILEPGKSPELATDAHPDEHHGTDGPNAIAVCLFIGACSAVVAAFSTRKLKHL